MFPLTFDWAQISYVGSPLMTPFWAAANVVAGLVVVMWVVAPILCLPLPPFLSTFSLLSPLWHPSWAAATVCMYLTNGIVQITGTPCIVPTCRFFPVLSLIIPDIRTMYPRSLQRISCLTRRLTKTTVECFCPSREFTSLPSLLKFYSKNRSSYQMI